MPRMIGAGLSRREREIIDILHRRESATATEILEEMPDPPSNSAVRSILRILESKGHVRHFEEGKRYVYAPTQPLQTAAKTALVDVLRTFFGGSLEEAVKTLLTDNETNLSEDEYERLAGIIEDAKTAQRDDAR